MKYLIAFSGGLDSSVLLALFAKGYDTSKLRAIHIHHGLSPHADAWVMHCQKIAAAWGIALEVHYAAIKPQPKQSLEETARHARYTLFEKALKEEEVLVTAHHQNDQAETFLLHAIRGSGPHGLSAMPHLKPFGKSWHWRPLLQQSRATLLHYAKTQALEWIEDESNTAINFDRNFIRHDILAPLTTRWPKAAACFARSAAIQGELQDLLTEILAPTWKALPAAINALAVHPAFKTHAPALPLTLLETLSPLCQKYFLRDWIKKYTHTVISQKQLYQIQHTVISAHYDKQPQLNIGQTHLRRYANALWLIMPDSTPFELTALAEKMARTLSIPVETLMVIYPKPGERVVLKNSPQHRRLKKLLQTWRIPPWIRHHLPLVFYNNKLLAVGDIVLDKK